ncbi:AmpG family muropeptide MFS transporter [Candidatus Tisiphia endosymbiont of Beris chalybata]|uniref:AmpG family muropeptide MFS transporter n=1 Tax=Candidatus Tisiphia endosymbiont of Beris chalybata TaxID=3066262 RepID=UPI00312C732C
MLLSKIVKDYRLFEILVLGIVSGMPLAILYTSLIAWLKDDGIDISIITTFAVARLSYSLKVFWSPVVDYFKIPILSKFGHRKSWLVVCCSLISLVLLIMSTVVPSESLKSLYFLTICLGFLSATFDIAVDALRIEKFESAEQGIASATAVLGYRVGMLITGAGALYLAEVTKDWSATFITIGIIFAVAVIFIVTVKEQQLERDNINIFSFSAIISSVLKPFQEFFIRRYATTILLAVIFFKLGDAMLGVVTMPFYLELGYTKGQIALITKFYGFFATLTGAFAGGIVLYQLGHFRGLIITGIIQSLTHIAFIWLNHQTASNEVLFIAITIENFAGAMGTTALVSYISNLCNRKYSATQYALLTSSSSFFQNSITASGGSLVKMLGWDNFFILTIILALPGLIILFYLNKKEVKGNITGYSELR